MTRTRNRNRRPEQAAAAPQSAAPQDRPFVFKSRTGSMISIPSSAVFDPDADAAAALADAQKSGNELDAAAALLRFIQSGFTADIASTINLKLSELQDFTSRFMKHSGVSIPK